MPEEIYENAPLGVPRLTRPEQARRLLAEGVIDGPVAAELIRALRPVGAWRRWAAAHLLALGVALALAGVVCVFAHNYASMGRLAKFAILEGAVVAAAVAALWRGLDDLGGKVALTVASVLTGVLLAVFGQVYQTGADSWELFAGWLGLITLWALAGRFVWLWLTWLAVACAAAWFFFAQVVEPRQWFDPWWLWALYSALFAAFLAACECRRVAGRRWWRPLALVAALAPLTFLVCWLVGCLAAGDAVSHFPPSLAACASLALALAAGWHFYFRRSPDPSALALLSLPGVAVALCAVYGCVGGRLPPRHLGYGVVVAAALTLAVGWGWLWAWRRLRRALRGAAREGEDDGGV